jgi:hypothetical protein
MTVLTLHTSERLTCPDWCEDHDLFTVHGDDLIETHAGSVGYVVPTDFRDGLVDVRLASYLFVLDGARERPPTKVELRHEGHDISLGAADARVLAELLLAAAAILDKG